MTFRTEVIGDATLILGDCREVLPTLQRVDAVVTDPPFGVGFAYESHDDAPETYAPFMAEVVAACSRVVDGGVCVFWQGMPNADRWHEWFPKGFRLFAACKGFVQYRPTPIQFSWDPVVFWGAPRVSPSVERKDWHAQMLAPFGAGRERIEHPCPRPIEQVCYVVEAFTAEGSTVLDPFLGSGTTGVACARLGRKFIGIEIEPKYFDIACKRIEEAWKQPRLFEEPREKVEQAAFDLGDQPKGKAR